MANETVIENNKVTQEASEINVPEFMANSGRKEKTTKSSSTKLKYIKEIEGKDWHVLKEIDDLIGTLVSNDTQPEKVKINYSILVNTNYRTERIKGVIVAE